MDEIKKRTYYKKPIASTSETTRKTVSTHRTATSSSTRSTRTTSTTTRVPRTTNTIRTSKTTSHSVKIEADKKITRVVKPYEHRKIGRLFKDKEKAEKFYDLKNTPKDKLIVFAFGGLEEVGSNMMGFKYNDDIILIDMGLEFPDEELLGVDYIIPDVTCLEGLEKNIKGVFITHGHYDHIGAIPHLLDKLGNPPIFGLKLTIGLIKKRQEEFQTKSKPRFIEVGINDTLQLGVFKLNFIRVSHSIPDSVMAVIETPVGVVVHTGDWKFDLNPVDFMQTEFHKIADLYHKDVLALFGDSTNADQKGHQMSEIEVRKTLEGLFKQASGRIIIGTFASLLSRLYHIITIAEELGKKVIIDGRSMKANIEIAHELGYLKFNPKTIIDYKDMKNYPDDKIIIACTGAQGEDNAVLYRIANNEHKFIKMQPGDTVIFSSSIIPGNERSVAKLRDALYLHHANIINYHMMDVHAGGHAKQEDIKLLLKLVNPKYYIPIYGTHTHIQMNAEVARSMGIPNENILISKDGEILEFDKDRNGRLTGEKIQASKIFVDGLGIGDVSGIVIRDRKQMSEHGMIVIISTIDKKTGKLISNPDIISRGFIYMNANKKLVEEIRGKVTGCLIGRDKTVPFDNALMKENIKDEIGKFIYKKTHRTPMVLPVILEI